jgi:hypothetical protein
VDVPEELKQSLKGEDEETNKTNDSSIHEGNVMDDMLSSQKSNAEAIENSDLMKQVLQAYSKIKFSPFDYELRVKDASYAVTNHIQAYELSEEEKDKVHYNTVASSSFSAKFSRRVMHFMKTGEWRKKAETRVLLDGVNLKFESGKMYLVLGVSIEHWGHLL